MTELKYASCAFTGHRPQKLPWGYDETDERCAAFKTLLRDAVESVYEGGIRAFICGMALGADIYFAEAVLALRREDPDVTLEAAVPFPGQANRWSQENRARYTSLLEQCDAVTVVSEHYTKYCMMQRNRYMVDRSELLLAAYDGSPGGTKNTVEYAASRGLEIIRLPILTEL